MVKYRMLLTYFNEKEIVEAVSKEYGLKCQIFRIDGRSYVIFRCGDKRMAQIKHTIKMTDVIVVDEYRQRSRKRQKHNASPFRYA